MAVPRGYESWSRERKSKHWAAKRRRKAMHDRAMERRRAHQNDPARVTEPLTPRTMEQRLDSATRLRFGDEEREIQGQRNVSDEMQRRIPAWYADYRNAIAGAQQRTQEGYAQAGREINARNTQLQQRSEAENQRISQEAQADAARRGTTADPEQDRIAAQAAASRRAAADSQANLVSTIGANANTALGQRAIAAAAEQLGAQTTEAQRRRAVERLAKALAKEKGDFRVTERERIRDNEFKKLLEREAFGLDVKKAEDDAREDRSEARARTRKERAAQRDKDEDQALAQQREDRLGRPKARSEGGRSQAGTPASRSNAKQQFRAGLQFARRGRPKAGEGDALAEAIQSPTGKGGAGIKDPLLARAIAMTAIYGGVDQKTRDRVYREYGIYLRLSKKKPRNRSRNAPSRGGDRPT